MGKAMNGKDGSDIDQLNPCVRWFDPYFSWSHLHNFCWFFFPQPQWDGINAVVQVQRFAQKYQIMIGSYPIGSMVLLYMVTFTIIIPQMLAYIPAPWILWGCIRCAFCQHRGRPIALGQNPPGIHPISGRDPSGGEERFPAFFVHVWHGRYDDKCDTSMWVSH